MSKIYKYECLTEDDTIRIGKALSKIAKKRDIFLLDGTLGMGKTVLSRAFIQAATGAEEVPSPTFTLLQLYHAKEYNIYHFDLYRIKDASEIFEIGIEEAMYDGVSIIEWPEKMGNFRPQNAFNVKIIPGIKKDTTRIIEIEVFDEDKISRLNSLEF